MVIKDEHIREAEEILIGGSSFEAEERIPFIKDLESCDLLAVPGSGKTTALLAKLYCLSKNLPFDDGSGILVLSHTNAAVDEIENKLRKHCPSLFTYPNFVGTVQAFVNKYLVTPCYSQHYGGGLRVDDVLYKKEVTSKLNNTRRGPVAYFKNRNPSIFYSTRFWFDENEERILSSGISKVALDFTVPKSWNDAKKDDIKRFIINMKTNLLRRGVLHFDDCYYLAKGYCKKHSELKNILQQRFKYIFIDEMQDLETHQIDLIDELFFIDDSSCIIQRIGDVNQSIYSSGKKIKINADWLPRNQRFLTGSNRLTQEVADVVNYLTLDKQADEQGAPRFMLDGLRELERPIKPHLILFDVDTKDKLELKFKQLIVDNGLDQTSEGRKYGFKIIGWSAHWDNEDDHSTKMRLEDIFLKYNKDQKSKHKETYDTLSDYINSVDYSSKELKFVRKMILNIFTSVLRLEGQKVRVFVREREIERYYQVYDLINEIKSNEDRYTEWNKYVYKWSIDLLAKRACAEVYLSISGFVRTQFKEWFSLEVNSETVAFLEDEYKGQVRDEESEQSESNDIQIEIGTVHSAKGQTHCATMYVETSYYKYESQKKHVLDALQKNEHSFNITNRSDARAKQAFKMLYVGLSRPTHLLCYAMLKENVGDDIVRFESAGWEVVDITDDWMK